MDDYSDYYSENNEEDAADDDDGLDPGQSWFFDLTELPLIKTPPAMMEMNWITKLVEIVIDSEKEKEKLANQITNSWSKWLIPPESFRGFPVLLRTFSKKDSHLPCRQTYGILPKTNPGDRNSAEWTLMAAWGLLYPIVWKVRDHWTKREIGAFGHCIGAFGRRIGAFGRRFANP